MSSDETTVIIKYKVDKSSAKSVDATTRKVGDTLGLMATRADDASTSAKQLGKALRIKGPEAVIKNAANNMQDLEKSTRGATRSVEELNEAFGQTSRNVALAGDVESNLRTVGGTAGALGLGGAASGIGAAAEIPALVEALPKLKESIKGLPSAISEATQALGGVGGVGMIAGLGLAAVAIGYLANESKKAKAAIQEQIAAQQELNRLISTSSTENLEDIRREKVAGLDLAQSEQDRLTAQAEALTKAGGAWDEVIQIIVAAADAGKEVEKLTGEIEDLDEAIGDSGSNVSDYRNALLDQATQAGETVRITQEATARTAEQNQARISQISQQEAAFKAELDILKKSGDTSQTTVDRIRELEAQLASLGRESKIVGDSIASGGAKAVDSAKEAETAQVAAGQAAEQAAQGHKQYADAVSNINKQIARSIADANRKAKQSLKDLQKTLSQDLADAIIEANQERLELLRDANRDEQKEARDNTRTLAGLRKDAIRSERDAIRNRSFLALAELAEKTAEELEDTKEGFLEERKEREIALRLAMSDQREAQSIQRAERFRDYKRAQVDLRTNLKRQLADTRRGASRQLADAASARDKQLALARQGNNAMLQEEQRYQNARRGIASGGNGGSGNDPSGVSGSFNVDALLEQIGLI